MLRHRGHDVAEFVRHSDDIRAKGVLGAVHGGLVTPWNPWAATSMRREVERFKPDVVHVHNTFPLISPAIFHAIGSKSARVLTLHNYRLFCPAAIPMREGRVCTDCLDNHNVWPALRYGCYRGSRLATAPLAMSVALHRALDTWRKEVDAFITLSEFQRDRMVAAGLPAEKVHVKPNFFPGNPKTTPWAERGNYCVFVGRLSPEKGVESLLRAWRIWGADAPELRLVGDGPLRNRLVEVTSGLPVRFLGQISSLDAQAQIANARLLILPSECFEGFGLVVSEAFAFGTPVAVSNIGPLPSIVRHGVNGVIFEPGDAPSLQKIVRKVWKTPGELERLSLGARESFQQEYTEEANYRMLMEIYDKAIMVKREHSKK